MHLFALLVPLLRLGEHDLLGGRLGRLAHDLHAQAQFLLGPAFAPSLVAGVQPQVLQAQRACPRPLRRSFLALP